MTTVKELIDTLRKYPEDASIVMAADSEGNGFIQNCVVEVSHIYPEDQDEYYVETFSLEDHEDDAARWEEGDEPLSVPVLVVVLWP